MILSGELLSNGRLHKTRERGQDVDGRIDLLVVELTIDEDLTFRNITRQIRDRVGDIYPDQLEDDVNAGANIPSLGMVRMGIWVIDPFRPSTRPARS